MSTNRINVHGPVSPEIVAAITAVLLAMRVESKEPEHRSAWAQSNRPGKPWHQNGRRHWRDGRKFLS